MISLVVPVYNEEEIVRKLVDEIEAVMGRLDSTWEAIFVDDGSRDQTLPLLVETSGGEPPPDRRATLPELGPSGGDLGWIGACRGDAVVLMDGDLQDPPSVIPQMIDAWKAGARVVMAQRSSRGDRALSRAVSVPFMAPQSPVRLPYPAEFRHLRLVGPSGCRRRQPVARSAIVTCRACAPGSGSPPASSFTTVPAAPWEAQAKFHPVGPLCFGRNLQLQLQTLAIQSADGSCHGCLCPVLCGSADNGKAPGRRHLWRSVSNGLYQYHRIDSLPGRNTTNRDRNTRRVYGPNLRRGKATPFVPGAKGIRGNTP